MVTEAGSFGSTAFVGSLSCGWNRIADALADPFGVPNINTAAMHTAITLVDTRCPSATRKHKRKSPHKAGFFMCLAERTGLAYILQAADARARASLRAPPEAARAASSTPQSRARKRAQRGSTNEKARLVRAFSFVWRSGRDSPTSCRPRMRVHAHPFESRRKPRRRLPPLRSHAPASGRSSDSTNAKARTRRAFAFVWRSGRDSNPRPPA